MHGVRLGFNGQASLDEKQLEEHLKSVKIDQLNIARVIADNTGKSAHQVEQDMNNRTTLSPGEAKDYGLVHEIRSDLFPIDAELHTIGESIPQAPQIQLGITAQPQGYTPISDMRSGTL
jgi:hypothetical protein